MTFPSPDGAGKRAFLRSTITKRSVTVAGRKTSVSLEEEFWAGLKEVAGDFAAHVKVGPSRTDLDNVGSKALLDWAQSRNLIANDKYLKRLSVERVSSTDAPEGCRLTLMELGT